jgi:myo-inositol-1-phosphate synthase
MAETGQIKVAIVGAGNCAQALLQGIEYYRRHPADTGGLMNADLGGYSVADITCVAAFDVDARKVGRDIHGAVFAEPNMAYKYPGVPLEPGGVTVQMGPIMDGVPEHLAELVVLSDAEPCDVAGVLRESGAEMLLNLLPTGSARAARFYADMAIREVGIGFINGMPELIVCDPAYQEIAAAGGMPLIGDDVKSQIGATIIHRCLSELFVERGIHIDATYQLNYAGNTDFLNLCNRGASKHKTKRAAVEQVIPYETEISTGFSYIELMKDRKTAYFWIDGGNFGHAPLRFEAKLEVEDSANFAGVMVDMIRYARIALDRNTGGVLESACAFLTKHPPVPMPDAQAILQLQEFVAGTRER